MEAVSQKKFGRIGVLMGGPSREREISLRSGKAVCRSLAGAGYDVVGIDINSDNDAENIRRIQAEKISCAFIALHGRYGEDGRIQQLLDVLNIPYTGSGSRASRQAMDKVASYRIFESQRLHVPHFAVIEKETSGPPEVSFPFPWVVKPVSQGSSIGLSVIDDIRDFEPAYRAAAAADSRVIVEEFIAGTEITVGILGDSALPVIEIRPKKRIFDFEAKYSHGLTEYIVPASIDASSAALAQEHALTAHRALGCSCFSRVDFILKDGVPYILEVNTIPGLTDTSLLPKAALHEGIEFLQLCQRMLNFAYEKKH